VTITVSLPPNMIHLTAGSSQLTAAGGSVLEVFDDLEARFPGIRANFVADGTVHRFMNVYVNDEDIRFADGLHTAVHDGDCLTLLCAVAGG